MHSGKNYLKIVRSQLRMSTMLKKIGKDVAAMKGKLTRKKPNTIQIEVVEFPPEIIKQISDLILSLDIFYVNNIANDVKH